MSAQIDVLAVMDRLEDYYRRHEVLIGPVDDAYSVEHKAARLAVAELIETLKCARDELSNLNSAYGAESVDQVIGRCDAALARARGAK